MLYREAKQAFQGVSWRRQARSWKLPLRVAPASVPVDYSWPAGEPAPPWCAEGNSTQTDQESKYVRRPSSSRKSASVVSRLRLSQHHLAKGSTSTSRLLRRIHHCLLLPTRHTRRQRSRDGLLRFQDRIEEKSGKRVIRVDDNGVRFDFPDHNRVGPSESLMSIGSSIPTNGSILVESGNPPCSSL